VVVVAFALESAYRVLISLRGAVKIDHPFQARYWVSYSMVNYSWHQHPAVGSERIIGARTGPWLRVRYHESMV
jgi:hypothetical protein